MHRSTPRIGRVRALLLLAATSVAIVGAALPAAAATPLASTVTATDQWSWVNGGATTDQWSWVNGGVATDQWSWVNGGGAVSTQQWSWVK